MREGIGEWFTYNIIIIFIAIVFALLAATLSYYKAFKLNASILYSIDKFEGYNNLSAAEIDQLLDSYGYTKGSCNAVARGGIPSISNRDHYCYQVYYIEDDTAKSEKNAEAAAEPLYYNYGVVTYIWVDLPIAKAFKIPVYTKGERIYNFTDGQKQENLAQ